jgi:hypothetical protein
MAEFEKISRNAEKKALEAAKAEMIIDEEKLAE